MQPPSWRTTAFVMPFYASRQCRDAKAKISVFCAEARRNARTGCLRASAVAVWHLCCVPWLAATPRYRISATDARKRLPRASSVIIRCQPAFARH
ncbi:hypothetical protein NPIL_225081 [Nephila pilipes]|uniref:Uncharacterized protein n=1 Tax=Nephila pilipes TaxID=299642 RepID=A0A8X6TR53_NEPPI|nr:hypothetical protein NPIL_225081 [Nephila pilipes]